MLPRNRPSRSYDLAAQLPRPVTGPEAVATRVPVPRKFPDLPVPRSTEAFSISSETYADGSSAEIMQNNLYIPYLCIIEYYKNPAKAQSLIL